MLSASVGSPLLWAGFIIFVLGMLAIDLGVFHREHREVTFKDAAGWSLVWLGLAALFNVGLLIWFGADKALEFTTAYLIEKALAVDNIFVFVVIFSACAIPTRYQHRVLFWGVLGALAMRSFFIVAGGALLQRFHWSIYLFGAILVLTGLKLLSSSGEKATPTDSRLVALLRRWLPVTPHLAGDRFTVIEQGKRVATPLLLALIAVELTDVVFAVDSIPAIFAVTTDPFIVFTSNIFAILGLRTLYFVLSGLATKFTYLKVGLSLVLLFVGAKMLLLSVVKVPVLVSLGVVAGLLAASIVASVIKASRTPARPDLPCES